jgi:hypothetical protein
VWRRRGDRGEEERERGGVRARDGGEKQARAGELHISKAQERINK